MGKQFWETPQLPLSEKEVRIWSQERIRSAINEMYARRGYVFKTAEVRRQFEATRWYHAVPGLTIEEIEQGFSEIERKNMALLIRMKSKK
jgi:hypothetical protein